MRVERAGRRPVYNGEPLCAQEAELGGRQVKGLRTCPSALEAERDGARLKGVLDRGPRGAGTQGSAGSRCPAQTSRDPVAAFRRGVPSHQQPHPGVLATGGPLPSLLAVSVDLLILDVLCKQNHAICDLLCLASFPQYP